MKNEKISKWLNKLDAISLIATCGAMVLYLWRGDELLAIWALIASIHICRNLIRK